MKILLIFVFFWFLIFLGLFTYTWFRLYEKLHLHVTSSKQDFPKGLFAQTQMIKGREGKKIAYWYFPVEKPKALLILVHGYSNPGGKAQMLGHVSYLRRAGYSTALIDLGSFGESEGNKISLGVNEWKDLNVLYDHLKSLPENQNKKIGYLGISMGAVTSLMTAAETGKGDFVIASVPYANFSSLFHSQIKSAGLPPEIFYPFMKIAAYIELGVDYEKFTPEAVVERLKVPVFIITAKEDKDLNSQDTKIFYQKLHVPKEFWEAEGGHDVFDKHKQEFEDGVLAFLRRHAQ